MCTTWPPQFKEALPGPRQTPSVLFDRASQGQSVCTKLWTLDDGLMRVRELNYGRGWAAKLCRPVPLFS